MAYQKKVKLRKLVSITTRLGQDQLEVLNKDASGKDTDVSKLIRDSIDNTYDIKLPDNGNT